MQIRTLLAGLTALTFAGVASAATLVSTGGTGDLEINSNGGGGAGGATWDNTMFPPSFNANIYVDLDTDGVFGELGIGENDGNVNAGLGFEAAVTDGGVLHFAMEGFPSADASGTIDFVIRNVDLSTQSVSVVEGVTTAFTDSNGDQWEADFEFNNGAYGDVVFNGGVGVTGAFAPDHQGILIFTQVPEPGSLALLGLGGLALLRRRRA